MVPIENAIDDLFAVAETFNRESESINSVIESVEERLEKAKIGLECWVDPGAKLIGATSPERTGSETVVRGWRLGYTKLSTAWRLAVWRTEVRSGFVDGDSSMPYREFVQVGEPVPLGSATRQVRIEATGNLEGLIRDITTLVRAGLTNIESAKRLVAR